MTKKRALCMIGAGIVAAALMMSKSSTSPTLWAEQDDVQEPDCTYSAPGSACDTPNDRCDAKGVRTLKCTDNPLIWGSYPENRRHDGSQGWPADGCYCVW